MCRWRGSHADVPQMRMRRPLLALILLAATPISAAEQVPTPARSTLRVQRGVVTAVADAPLQRVRVLVSAAGLSADPVFTNELGAFDVQVPVAAAYTLTLTKPGFARQEVRGAGGAPETPLRIRLERGAAINGRVVDQFGDPTRRSVRLQGAGLELSGDTDDLGAFRFGSLPAGRYVVRVVSRPRPAGSVLGDPEPSVVDLGAGSETNLILTVEEDLAIVVNGNTVQMNGPSASLGTGRGAGPEQPRRLRQPARHGERTRRAGRRRRLRISGAHGSIEAAL